ncbi:Hypothetical predicted protein [Mytilus galloprovincialis]|uniref:Uncharacterized protein n=1 Tax=Mytilus galloprovincialis TaxID=29158 RepID=A0A8B6C9M2_MYTGA|nr:Hypothetical predicted protein [Mytilus galloprovincialis]
MQNNGQPTDNINNMNRQPNIEQGNPNRSNIDQMRDELEKQIRQEMQGQMMEMRLKQLESQMVQFMCLNTSITTQMMIQSQKDPTHSHRGERHNDNYNQLQHHHAMEQSRIYQELRPSQFRQNDPRWYNSGQNDPRVYNYGHSQHQTDPRGYISEQLFHQNDQRYNSGHFRHQTDPGEHNYGQIQHQTDPRGDIYGRILHQNDQRRYIYRQNQHQMDPRGYNSGQIQHQTEPRGYNSGQNQKQHQNDPRGYTFISGQSQTHQNHPKRFNSGPHLQQQQKDQRGYNYEQNRHLQNDPRGYNSEQQHHQNVAIGINEHSDNGQRKEKSNSEISSSPLRHAEIEIKLAQAIDQLTNPESLLNEEQNLKETPTITATPNNEITVPNNQHVDHPSMNLPQHTTEEEKQKQQHFLGKIGQPKEPPDIQELGQETEILLRQC